MIEQSSQPAVRGRVVILVTFAIALVLQAVPLPRWAAPYRPDWVGLVLIYWCMATPQRVGVGSGWVAGLVLDVMQGSLLGQNALAKAVLAFLANTFHLRIRMFPVWQQALTVLAFTMVNQALIVWIKGVTGELYGLWWYWAPCIASMVIWPWLFIILRDVRRYGRVS
jgi:rod shape-determining protein MreD